LEIARKIFAIAVDEHGLRPGDLVFDALTFTLATGDPEFVDSALETLQGIRLIKSELPGVLTSLGVSNVSFGLSSAARAILNSVMLFHAVQAGLDMAIVNPAQITPYSEITLEEREFAEDLILNRRPDALVRLIEHYQKGGASGKTKTNSEKEILQKLSAAQRLHWRILHRQKEGVEEDIDEILQNALIDERSQAAVQILNSTLLPAMKEVGDKFGTGELILPFVLQSAEVMKKSVAYLEKFLEHKEGSCKGKIVLATVYGDVHDIGKNLVKTILSNNGYEVIDLGKQVPAETIIVKAVEVTADAIGLSALLVSTSKQMPLIVNELQRRGLHIPVLIGGAAINPRFGRRILLTDQDTYYDGGVFYCKDAFEGLATMENLGNLERKPALLERIRSEAESENGRAQAVLRSRFHGVRASTVTPAKLIPHPPSWGPRLVHQMPLEIVFTHLAKKELFRLSWGAKNSHGEEWAELQAEYEKRLEKMCRQAIQEKWLRPQGIYGYWPAQSDGNDLVVFDPESIESGSPAELVRFSFPRQTGEEGICLADYFSSTASNVVDIVALQIATVGFEATLRFDRMQAANEYSEAYFMHGLAVQTAEACAEYLHQHIRRELGLAPAQGKRYSWGYPAIPELADHRKVFDLLPVESELGMHLTPAFQLIPEQSTAAIIVHHPQAKYFNTGETRVDQLMR
jgi:5-methyltetrahydrofolate--homocysteine methyltransferase